MARGNPRWLCAGSKAPTVRGGFGGPAAGVSRDRGHGAERKRLGDRTGTGPARVSSVQVIGEAGFAPSGAIISRVPVTIPSRGGIGLRESAAAAAGVALRPQAAAPSDRQSTSRAADGGASTPGPSEPLATAGPQAARPLGRVPGCALAAGRPLTRWGHQGARSLPAVTTRCPDSGRPLNTTLCPGGAPPRPCRPRACLP